MADKSEIIIRAAVPEDAARIAELERICFPLPWTEESLLYDIVSNDIAKVMVAESNGELAAYADVWCIAGEGQLNNIAVFPEFRGMHIGQTLMEAVFEMLRESGNTEISLEVRPSNVAAVTMYEKLGFGIEGRREGYYIDNGEAALIMRKAL